MQTKRTDARSNHSTWNNLAPGSAPHVANSLLLLDCISVRRGDTKTSGHLLVFAFCISRLINGALLFSNGVINPLFSSINRLINGSTRLVHGRRPRGPGQASQPLISRVRPVINQVMLFINWLVPLISARCAQNPQPCFFFAYLAAEQYCFHVFSSQFVKNRCKQ